MEWQSSDLLHCALKVQQGATLLVGGWPQVAGRP